MRHLQFYLHVPERTNEILCASGTWPGLCTVSQWTTLNVIIRKWLTTKWASGKWERGLFAGLSHWVASWAILIWAKIYPERTSSDFLWMPLETLFQAFPGSGLWWLLSDSVSIAWLWLRAWWCIICLPQAQGIVKGKDVMLKQHENFVIFFRPYDSS